MMPDPEKFRPGTPTIRLGILGVLACLVVLRIPEIIYPGRFFAEEGTIYFREAYTTPPARVLRTTNLGYYSLYNKVAALVAVHAVPLVWAPVVTGLFAFAAQMIPFAMILFSNFDGFPSLTRKIGACLLVLLVQPNQEVWLNTINSQFFFCVSCGLVLISRPTRNACHVFRLCVLVLAGLTGVVSCLLLPLFVLSYAHGRPSHRLHEILALGFACAIQAIWVMTTAGRESYPYVSVLPFALLVKQWLLPLSGGRTASCFGELIQRHAWYQSPALACAAALPYMLAGTAMVAWGRKDAVLFLGASMGIASLSFLKSVEAQGLDGSLLHVSAYGAGRYYYAPNAFLALAFLMIPADSPVYKARWRRAYQAACYALVALFLVVGAGNYLVSSRNVRMFSGPSWTEQVRNWREGKTDTLNIWPRGWQMTLPRTGVGNP
jgi:hypothetical protein